MVMMEEGAKSGTFIREESHVSTKDCWAWLSLRTLVGVLAILNIFFAGFLGFTFYTVLDLKQQVRQLGSDSAHRNGVHQPLVSSAYANGSDKTPKQNTTVIPNFATDLSSNSSSSPLSKEVFNRDGNINGEGRTPKLITSTSSTRKGNAKAKPTITSTNYHRKERSSDCSCPGPRGFPGPPGTIGPQGLRGKKGKKGDQGPRGYDGNKGAKGERGLRGDFGLRGEQGMKGPPGKAGPLGASGPQGSKGERGHRGLKGEKGEKGDGTVTVREKPKPYAHITGTISRQKSNREPRGIIRRQWRDFGLFALIGNGFRFVNGELIIPEDGLYYLYSQVYFNHNDREKDANIAHFMYKKSGSVGETILTSLVTRSVQLGTSPVLYNGFTAGQFHCRKGDRLMVGVSEELLNMAQFIESLSYFGGYLIQQR